MNQSDRVRAYVASQYLLGARERRERSVRIVVGEVQRALGLHQRTPLVCAALRSQKFLRQAGVVLERVEGPPSGMSPKVAFTYRLVDNSLPGGQHWEDLHALRGMARAVFHASGGGEQVLRQLRCPDCASNSL